MITQQYRCTGCQRTKHYDGTEVHHPAELARVAGWRIGTTAGGQQVAYCPACVGTDPQYWTGPAITLATTDIIWTAHRQAAA